MRECPMHAYSGAQYVQMPKGTPKNKFGQKLIFPQKWEFLSLNTGRSRRALVPRPLGPSGLTASPAAPSPRSTPSPVRLRPP
eukprot:100478-Prymnesium_polylepis.1